MTTITREQALKIIEAADEVISALAGTIFKRRLCVSGINMPLQVEVEGRTWKLFSVDFTADERKYSFYIYAINREHASYIVDDIKRTAELSPGNIVGIVSSQDKK